MIRREAARLGLASWLCAAFPAQAQSPNVKASPSLQCFQDETLARQLRSQIGEQASRHWQLILSAKGPQGLELVMRHRGKTTGRRSFAQLPDDCASQQRLVSTVAVLAIENWQSQRPSKPPPASKGRANRPRPAPARESVPDSPKGESSQNKRQKPTKDSGIPALETKPKPSAEQKGGEQVAPVAKPRKRRPRQPDNNRAQEERDAASLARDIARQQAQEREGMRKAPGPFTLEGGLGLGVAYGLSANVGPVVDGWLAAARKRFALRVGGRLNYAIPRKLGPARLHTGLVALNLDLCLRPGRYAPSGALEFWGCLGATGGFVIAKGQGSDEDQAGLRPVAGPTLTFELPIAQRNRNHWAIAVHGGLNLVRTRFDLRSTKTGAPLLHSYTMPPFHLGLQLHWRKSSEAR